MRDYLYGEDGFDYYFASSDGATMNDLSHGSLDGNQFFGAGGVDYVFGDYGSDWVETYGGNDVIYTYYGSDKIFSGCMESSCTVDDDTVYAGPDNDYIEGGNGADELNGEGGDDCIIGDNQMLGLSGHEGSDTIYAGETGEVNGDCVYCDNIIIDDYISCQWASVGGVVNDDDHAFECLDENKCGADCRVTMPAYCNHPES